MVVCQSITNELTYFGTEQDVEKTKLRLRVSVFAAVPFLFLRFPNLNSDVCGL